MRRLRNQRDHRCAQRHMSDYVDGELSPRRRRQLEAHARLCPECGPLRRSLIVLIWELRQLGRARTTETVAGGVIERLRSEPLPPDSSGPATRLR